MAGSWKRIGLAAALLTATATATSSGPGGAEAVSVLRAFGEAGSLAPNEEILGMTGFNASPRPEEWLILVGTPGDGASFREIVVSGGAARAERRISPLPGQEFPRLRIEAATLRVTSDEAFRLAAARARTRGAAFLDAHLQLRVRDEGAEPVWMLKLLDRFRREVGLVYLSARSGAILREVWPAGGSGTPQSETKAASR